MAATSGSDIQINGGGTLDSGSYGVVTVNGVGTIKGDIACDTLRVNGATTSSGSIKANTVEVNGTARVDGTLQAHTLLVNGETTLSSGAGVGTLTVKGRLTCYGDINARALNSAGSLSITGTLAADDASIEGIVTADRIVAPTVRIGLHGPSSVREIEGTSVTVARGKGWAGLSVMAVLGDRRLTSASIVGSAVSLELTTVNAVRAGNVTLGEGCRVGSVSYTGTFEQRADAAVTHSEKVELA